MAAFEEAFGSDDRELHVRHRGQAAGRTSRNESFAFDVVIGATTLNLPSDVVGNLIQPLNQEYLTNFNNVLRQPAGARTTTSARSTPSPTSCTPPALAYRRDVIDDAMFAADDSWKVMWDPTYKGYVGVIDDAREALTLAMYYRGVTDTNTGDPAIIDARRRLTSRPRQRPPMPASTSSPTRRSPTARRT